MTRPFSHLIAPRGATTRCAAGSVFISPKISQSRPGHDRGISALGPRAPQGTFVQNVKRPPKFCCKMYKTPEMRP